MKENRVPYDTIERIHAELPKDPFKGKDVINYEELRDLLNPILKKLNLGVRHSTDIQGENIILVTHVIDFETGYEWKSTTLVEDELCVSAGLNLVTLFSLWEL